MSFDRRCGANVLSPTRQVGLLNRIRKPGIYSSATRVSGRKSGFFGSRPDPGRNPPEPRKSGKTRFFEKSRGPPLYLTPPQRLRPSAADFLEKSSLKTHGKFPAFAAAGSGKPVFFGFFRFFSDPGGIRSVIGKKFSDMPGSGSEDRVEPRGTRDPGRRSIGGTPGYPAETPRVPPREGG